MTKKPVIWDWACTIRPDDHPVQRDLPVTEAGYRCSVCGGPMRHLYAPAFTVYRGKGWARKER